MRTRALPGALLVALAAVPAPTAGQSLTQIDLSYGLFDGVGIGMTHVAHVAESPAFGMSVGSGGYGIYSEVGRGRGRDHYAGDYRYAGRYDDSSDSCWDEAWDLRWGRGYYGWHSSYDHLDFYHDCRVGGIDYAYDRWRWHSRRAYRHYDAHDYGRWGRGVYVSIYVKDPFWRPWGPYWSYDPWGWYWDGYRDGFRDGRWARGGGVVYGGAFGGGRVRTVYSGRPSPLAPTRFKEDPRVLADGGGVRRAQPRAQPTADVSAGVRAPSAPARASGRPGASAGRGGNLAAPARGGARAPAAPARQGGEGPAVAGRPSDRIRGGKQPSLQPDGGSTRARPSAPVGGSPRTRPSDASEGGARPRAAEPSARGGDARPSTPSARSPERTTRAAPPAPATRREEPAREHPATRSAPRADVDRPAAREPAARQPSRAPSTERAPEARRPSAAPAPSARRPPGSGESTRSAPATRSGGESTPSAPAARRPATR